MNVIGRLAVGALLALAGTFAMQAHAQYDGRYQEGRYNSGVNTVRCASHGYNRNFCRVDTRGGVRLTRQISDTACVRGRNWDYNGRGIWVTNGCAADFIVGGYYPGYGPDRPDYGVSRIVRCESINHQTQHCRANTEGGVRLVHKLSDSSCYQGTDWGWDRGGIWVANGCRAEFQAGGFYQRGYEH
ncbi:MAG: DUF3011 domain-containing protein [Lysobacteraceae bacterium]